MNHEIEAHFAQYCYLLKSEDDAPGWSFAAEHADNRGIAIQMLSTYINNKRRLLPDMSPEYVNGLIENNIVNVFRKIVDMRKKVIVLVSLLFVLVDMYAQTFYYDTTQVFYAQRYVCDVTQESKSVRLYSKSNKFTEVEAVNKETGAEITDAERKEANFVDDSQLWGKCLSILNESFSEEERTRVQGCKFIIILRVDTNTGIIRDVEYRFPAVSMLATVPVSVYQEMEIKLKKEIVFNITEKGKRFNYIPFVWAHTVK